jgi:hypothetical protein
VAELPADCTELRLVAAELALGTLEGSARGEALAHLAGCPACRAHVQELAEVVDEVLGLAPVAEPPPGFESGVIDRVTDERRAGRTGLRVPLLVAAAVVLLIVGLVVGFAAAGLGDGGGEDDLAWATMVAPGGDSVGEVWRYGEDEAALFVSVPAWAQLDEGGPRYALRLELADGETMDVGDFGLGDGTSSWGVSTDVDAETIAAVSVVDDTGRVWCTGEFT